MDRAGAGTIVGGDPSQSDASSGAHVLRIVRSLGPGRILALGMVALAMIAFFTFVIFRVVEQPYELLFSGLEPADAQDVTTRLAAAGVRFRLDGDGSAVLVPSGEVLRWRMSLAQEGLPTGGTIGDELFDRANGLTTTDFLADVSVRRALEGELARTIASLRPVRAARVHIVEPKQALFRRQGEAASASIVVTLASGAVLDPRQVAGIRHLVAGAVPQLEATAVSILDDRGNLLARPEDPGAGPGIDEIEDHRAAFEQRVRDKLIQLLESSVGSGRAEVEVAADFDFDEVETTSESYDPDGQIARSTQSVDESTERSETEPDGGVSVANNLPTERAAGPPAGRTQERVHRTEDTSNYEISKTVKNQHRRTPALKQLSIAVQVDGVYRPNADGTAAFEPRSADELAQLETLVRSAAGASDERGDVVRVVSRQFVAAAVETEASEPLLGITSEGWWRAAELATFAVVSLAMLMFGVRPALQRLLPVGTVERSAAANAGGAAEPAGGASSSASGEPLPAQQGAASPLAAIEEQLTQLRQVNGQVRTSLIDEIGHVVETRPGDAVRVVRSWLHGS